MAGVVLVSHDLVTGLAVAARRDEGIVVLLDGAAAAVRATHPHAEAIRRAQAAGTVVCVHDEAAQRRGLRADGVLDGIKTLDYDEIADLVAESEGGVMWL